MDPKSILAVIPDSVPNPGPAIMAIDIARRFDGYVDCLLVGEEDQSGAVLPSQAGSAGQLAAAHAAAEARRKARHERIEALRDTLRRICSEAGVPIVEYEDALGNGAAGSPAVTLRTLNGNVRTMTGRCAQACDLVVMPSPEPGRTREIAEAALLESGRPVLLAPQERRGGIGHHVIIGWDPSAQAWHAVSAALPFMQTADDVTIAIVGANGTGRESTQDLLDYLKRHDIEASTYVTEPHGSVGETLLELAKGREADLLVMGGYSHSRLREALLGGTTRYMLSHAPSTPVLMAH